MKRKMLFVCYGLGVGGIEKCLVNLLNAMPERFDIDVLLMNPQHTFKNQIRRPVRFLNTFDYVMNIEDTPGEILKCRNLARKVSLLWSYCLFRLRIKLRKKAWVRFKPLHEEYDIAIAYSHHDFSPYYVIDKVRAKKKVMWYHNGAYEETGKRYDWDQEYYTQFDHVVAVSTDCAKALSKKFSFQDGQLIILKNLCDVDDIRDKAEQYTPSNFSRNCIHIVTVGRMTPEKGADLAVEACKILSGEGRDICWHWVGDGNQLEMIREKVSTEELDGRFILEGNQDNPYPFIRCADIYVQPSYYEAYSTTITEAKVLCRPIVTTDVGGMRDQLYDGVNGLIVPVDASAIAEAIKTLMDEKEVRCKFSKTLMNEDYSSEGAMRMYLMSVFS